MTYVLWTLQALLALLFVFAGGMKLVTPLDVLVTLVPLPGAFIRFVGVAELLGGLGLVLPGLLRVRPWLAALAAAELAHLMLAATLLTLAMGADATAALLPLLVGLLATFVAYARWRLAPHRAARPTLRHAAALAAA